MATKKKKKKETPGVPAKSDRKAADWFLSQFDKFISPPTDITPESIGVNPVVDQGQAYGEFDALNPGSKSGVDYALGLTDSDVLRELIRRGMEGIDPTSMQMARERARGEISNSLTSAIRGSLGSAGNLGIFGRDMTRGLIRPGEGGLSALQSNANALGNLERDLFLQNLDYKDANLKNAADYQINAGNVLNNANQVLNTGRSQFFQDKFQSAQGAFNSLYNVAKGNQDSLNAYQLSRMGSYFGGLGYADAQKQADRAYDLSKQSIAASGSRSSSPSNGSGNLTFNVAGGQNVPPAGPTNNNSAVSGSTYG